MHGEVAEVSGDCGVGCGGEEHVADEGGGCRGSGAQR